MKYPYYIVPDVEEYRKLDPDSEEAKKLSRKIAANIGDYASLRLVLGIDPPEFAHFYPDMETSTPTTLDTIDSFLDKFGGNLPPTGYIAELENSQEPHTSSMDNYTLSEEESESEDKYEDWDIEKNENPKEEDFGKLVKEQRFQEALELIERQNLNNPKKSIYFAHQISFLKKLIALETYRKQTKG